MDFSLLKEYSENKRDWWELQDKIVNSPFSPCNFFRHRKQRALKLRNEEIFNLLRGGLQ